MCFPISAKGETNVISWDAASAGCQDKHNSVLLPQQYWQMTEAKVSRDVLAELDHASSAWINGQTFDFGCKDGVYID